MGRFGPKQAAQSLEMQVLMTERLGLASDPLVPTLGETPSTSSHSCRGPSNRGRLEAAISCFGDESGWPDLNRRPLDPQSSALPNCATARSVICVPSMLLY